MDREEHLVSAVHWLDTNLSFDLDARVHVFELTIRALGEQRARPPCMFPHHGEAIETVLLGGCNCESFTPRPQFSKSLDGFREILGLQLQLCQRWDDL